MDRWDWMAVRAYAPAALALAIAFALTWVIGGWQESRHLASYVSLARWAPLAALAFAFGHGSWTTFRIWRAERGDGLLCECGGLLGYERDGRYGPYRRCLACSRNIAQQHYE